MNHIIFKELNISNALLRAIADMGFEEATPIQSQSILPILEGSDVLAQAPTGTGKTCAFGIPLVERVEADGRAVEGLILCPTRELAIQTTEELLKLCKFKQSVKVVPIYGGQPIERQIYALKKRPQIIVATPGRLMDHLRRHTIKLNDLRYIVLDEADEMLNMGFREDIDTILQTVPETRQTILFSATLSKEIREIAALYQNEPVQIKIAHKTMTVPSVEQYYLEVKGSQKTETLMRLVDAKHFHLSIVFCNTKRMVDELVATLGAHGYRAEALHGDIKQVQRDKVMARFRKGAVEILVATDVAARGIDVDDVEAVINYDIPTDPEYYVHRIGRTGRANKAGVAYTLASGPQMGKLREIMRFTKSTIIPTKLPTMSEVQDQKLRALFDELSTCIKENELTWHLEAVERFLEESDEGVTSLELAAALLSREIKPAPPEPKPAPRMHKSTPRAFPPRRSSERPGKPRPSNRKK